MTARHTVVDVLVVVAILGAIVGGVGLMQVIDADVGYRIAFGDEDDRCRGGYGFVSVYVDVDDGTPLACDVRDPAHGIGRLTADGARVGFPGFTREQNAEVASLAKRLGAGVLSEAEQRLLRDRVAELEATVPEARRPDNFSWFEGWSLLWAGLGTLLVSALAVRLIRLGGG